MMDKEDTLLITKYATQVAAFRRDCCDAKDDAEADDYWARDLNFFDLSIGYFIAKGITGDSSEENCKYYDAHRLASIIRYELQYWNKK